MGLSNREFADEFFRVIEDGQFSEEAMDFVDALSRTQKNNNGKPEITDNGIAFLRNFKSVYEGEPLSTKQVTDKMGVSTARGAGGVVNSLVKKGYLTKVFNPQSSKITLYDLTEKGKEFNTERKINKGE